MAQNTKITKWAKDNQEALYMLYEDGVLSEEQLRTLVNLKGNYDVASQDAEFDKVKQTIQSKLTDDRIKKAVKDNLMSDNDAKIYGSLFKSVDKFDKPKDGLLSSKLTQQINESGYQNIPIFQKMSEQIKDMSDKDVKEYIYNQREFLNKTLPGKAVEAIPELKENLIIQPSYGVSSTDYAKMFNDEDILDKFTTLPFRDIDYVARKNGMSGKELIKDMMNAKIAKDREAIAHGRWDSSESTLKNIRNEVGGTLLTLFGRRQQEAIERGEKPELRDIAGDVGEQLAYMAPVGRIAGPVARVLSRIPKIGKYSNLASTTAGVASNAIVPTLSEIYDSMAYGDDNPRGEFSPVDALVGTTVNAVTPIALREAGSGIARLTGSKGIQKTFGELAKGKTQKEILDEIKNKFKGVDIRDADNPSVSAEVRKRAQELKSMIAADKDLETVLLQKDPIVYELAKERGETLSDKARNYVNRIYPDGYTMIDVDGKVNKPTVSDLYQAVTDGIVYGNAELTRAGKLGKWLPEAVRSYEENPNVISDRLMNVYDKMGLEALNNAKTSRQLIEEDLLKNYLTNQSGNFIYADKEVRVPGLSMLPINVNQLIKDNRAKKEREKAKNESRMRLPSLEYIFSDK